MKNILFSAALLAASTVANAAGNASLTCGSDQIPVLSITYNTFGDAGMPGYVFLGVLSPDQTSGAVMTESGWTNYQGGLYPYMSRFMGGLPGVVTTTMQFPGNSTSTAAFAGYAVYMGHGVYSAESQKKVQDRRATLNQAKPALIAAGTWNAEYDSDDRYIWSLIQKDMVDNNKNGVILTIPPLDCSSNIN